MKLFWNLYKGHGMKKRRIQYYYGPSSEDYYACIAKVLNKKVLECWVYNDDVITNSKWEHKVFTSESDSVDTDITRYRNVKRISKDFADKMMFLEML